MKQSTYDPLWRELLETTDTPLSVHDLVERSGASKQRAHVWIRDNEQNLVEVGKTVTGGRSYVWKTNMLAKDLTEREQEVEHIEAHLATTRIECDEGIRIGTRLTVSELRVNQGHVVVELVDETGTIYTATLNL